VSDLARALDNPNTRTEGAEAILGLIDGILTPEAGAHQLQGPRTHHHQ
jgi:hypothetical protein